VVQNTKSLKGGGFIKQENVPVVVFLYNLYTGIYMNEKRKMRDQKRLDCSSQSKFFVIASLSNREKNENKKKWIVSFLFCQFKTRNYRKKWKCDFSIWHFYSKQKDFFEQKKTRKNHFFFKNVLNILGYIFTKLKYAHMFMQKQ